MRVSLGNLNIIFECPSLFCAHHSDSHVTLYILTAARKKPAKPRKPRTPLQNQ